MPKIDLQHRLVEGDGTEFIKSLQAESVQMILTDPPYGINYRTSWRSGGKINGVKIKSSARKDEYFEEIVGDSEMPLDWLADAFRVLKQGGALYVFSNWRSWGKLLEAVEGAGFKAKNMLVFSKYPHGMGDLKGSYSPKHELATYATKGRAILRGKRLPDVLQVPRINPLRSAHPMEKPRQWLSPLISASSDPGDLVLDLFAGVGSVACACHDLGRRSISVEIDPKFSKIIKGRLACFGGLKSAKVE